MAITLDAFRAFADSGIGDRKTVNVGDEAKTTLAQTRFTGDRPIASRQIVAVETAQDNIYVRSQLLTALRDALAGTDDDYFRAVEAKLFGMTPGNDQADVAVASKPLTLREVRAVLGGLDERLRREETRAAFSDAVERTFLHCNQGGEPLSQRSMEMVRAVLIPAARQQLAANPRMTFEELTGPDSTFALLREVMGRTNLPMPYVLQAASLPPASCKAYLKACSLLVGHAAMGLNTRLHAVADQLAALKARDFTPAKIFALACPDTPWPKGISTRQTTLTPAERRTLAEARLGGLPDRVMTAGDPAEGEAGPTAAERYSACLQMFECGMTRADVARVLDDFSTFTGDMIPPGGYLCGQQMVGGDVDDAFETLARDLPRNQPSITIRRPGQENWTSPNAIRLDSHPLHAMALQDLRAQVDALCGPGASASMRANIFLSMSQNTQMVDGFLRPLAGLGSGCASFFSYSLARNDDGSVTVSRTLEKPSRVHVEMSFRFFPDGTQRLEREPRPVYRLRQTPQDVRRAVDEGDAQTRRNVDGDLQAYVNKNYGAAFADLFQDEIAEVEATFPRAQSAKRNFRQYALNQFDIYLSSNRDAVRRFCELPEAGRPAALQAIKAEVRTAALTTMQRSACAEECKIAAQEALLAAARELDGRMLDLSHVKPDANRIGELITYLKFEGAERTLANVRAACERTRDDFIAARRAVLDAVKGLTGPEAAAREQLLVNVLEYPRLGLEAFQATLELARALPLPPVGTRLDAQGLKEAMLQLGHALREAYARLDPQKVSAEHKGNMSSTIIIYLGTVRQAEMRGLFSQVTPDELMRIFDEIKPDDGKYGGFDGNSPEYQDYMARKNVQTLIKSVAGDLGIVQP